MNRGAKDGDGTRMTFQQIVDQNRGDAAGRAGPCETNVPDAPRGSRERARSGGSPSLTVIVTRLIDEGPDSPRSPLRALDGVSARACR